ncbi:MAG: OsmC family protein [Nitrospirae bacterium]|nr:OsmC family protein [Nitrospirota bacterium]
MSANQVSQEKELMVISPGEGVELEIRYRNHSVIVDQPLDAGGKNRGMTPVELFVGSLGACIGYYAVRFCLRHQLKTEGLQVSIGWAFEETPHRIGSITVQVSLPKDWNTDLNQRFQKVLEGCPVHQSIKFEPKILIALKK